MAVGTDKASTAYRVQPRSVIPGRQRWDIGLLLGRPRMAEVLEADLRELSAVGRVQANPITGRLLVLHDPAADSEEIGQLVRQAAARLSPLTVVPPTEPIAATRRPSSLELGAKPGWEGLRHRSAVAVVVVGGGAAAVALGGLLLHSPMARLGAVLGATAAVLWRGWKRTRVRRGLGSDTARRPVRQIVGSHTRQLYLASFLSAFATVLFLEPALFLGRLLTVLMTGPTPVLVRLGLSTTWAQVTFLACVMGAMFVAYAVVSYCAGRQWRDLAQSVQFEWRTEMYAHVQRAELRFLEGERTTRLAGVLTDDIDQFGRFLAGPANTLVQIATSFGFLVPVFLILAPSVAWIVFLPAPIIAWMSFSYREGVAPGHAESSKRHSLLSSLLINNLEASATVKSFSAEDHETDHVRRLSDDYRQSNRPIDRLTITYNNVVQLFALSSSFGFLLVGGRAVLAGTLPVAVFNSLVVLPRVVLTRMPELGEASEAYQRTEAALERVLALRRLPVESATTGRPLDVATVDGALEFEGVTFAYPGRSPAINDLSMRIEARKTTGIVGVTGTGKTTIAKLVLRLHDVESGRVLLDGVDTRELRLEDLRRAVGFVGQDAFLFDGTVGDNLRYGTFDADPGQVAAAARVAEAEGFVEALPSRYETMIGERGTTLSGGQKQRLSLARAIVKSPPILILDEATSAVDNETEAAIQRALADFARGRTLVIIAHRLSTIRNADWIFVIGEGGVVVEEGTHDQLLERHGVYASLWRLQIGEAVS